MKNWRVFNMNQLYKETIQDVLSCGLFSHDEIQRELEIVEDEIVLDRLLKISKQFGGLI